MPGRRLPVLLQHLLRAPVYLYRWRLGWLLGHRFLLLTHIGRRTGLRHQTVLEVMRFRKDSCEAVVMSGFGRNSQWLRNIEVAQSAEIDIGREHFTADHRLLSDQEAVEVLAKYEDENRFMLPVVRYVLGLLLGWRYRGTQNERLRVVQQLPLIAFRPKS